MRTCKAVSVAERGKRIVLKDNREVNLEALSWGRGYILMNINILTLLQKNEKLLEF